MMTPSDLEELREAFFNQVVLPLADDAECMVEQAFTGVRPCSWYRERWLRDSFHRSQVVVAAFKKAA